MATPTQAEIDQFTGNVKHMVMLQEQLKEIAAKAREQRTPVKEAFDSVQGNIIDFMKVGGIDVCNYQDEKIELQSVVRFGSLTRKTLRNGLASYFGSEEDPRVQECFDHIVNSLGQRELDILKRVRKRGKRAAAKKPKPSEDQAPDISDDSDNN